MKLDAETILVSKSGSVVIVGRQSKGEKIEIVNAFKGEEANELWERLTVMKEK